MREIDGAYLEGGGQLLRTAIALSAMTGQPCRIFNLRQKRRPPGLRPQHLEALNATARFCGAGVEGNHLGSGAIVFSPGHIPGGPLELQVSTAASVALLLQPLMIAALGSPTAVTIRIEGGATTGKWAPPIGYLTGVLLPLLGKMGYRGHLLVERYGYYPRGGARTTAVIEPAGLGPLRLAAPGRILAIEGHSHASLRLQKARVAERQAASAAAFLEQVQGIRPSIGTEYVDTDSTGSGIELVARTENSLVGSDGLGERGKPAERVGEEAARELCRTAVSRAAVDQHAQDQLLPYMALARGASAVRTGPVTSHTQTNIWIIEQFLPARFSMEDELIRCIPRDT